MNQAVDAMTEEKNRLDEELQQARSEVTGQRNDLVQLDQKNTALQQRITSLEEQQVRGRVTGGARGWFKREGGGEREQKRRGRYGGEERMEVRG